MTDELIECVPNFSEGRRPEVIEAIAAEIRSVEGVWLLDVDPGKATHRTVMTMVGPPEAVIEAAVRSAKKAAELIDMTTHQGEHPRFGALDVCPLIPVSGLTMEKTVEYARRLGERLAQEVGLSIYFYERAATSEARRNLANVRAGEYEGLLARMEKDGPDLGPRTFQPKTGATAVGARDFLVAYNINLNTTSTRRANAIAFDVREKGREALDASMKPIKGPDGAPVIIPGSLKAVKGIGWLIEEYGIAQVSLNLTDISVTPVHVAFDECVKKAEARGVRVTGSELVGLIPLRALLDAGRYFLRKQSRSVGVSERELIKIAVKSLGLNDLYPFVPEEKIIEFAIAKRRGGGGSKLAESTLRAFIEETASESAAPGGGSIAAAMGAFGAALGAMVANLTSHKRGFDAQWERFSDAAEAAQAHATRLTQLVDEDTAAFEKVMATFALPKSTDAEKKARTLAIQAATLEAARVPLEVMRVARRAMTVLMDMAQNGNAASVSDAGVGALAARAAVRGAHLNVLINCESLKAEGEKESLLGEARDLAAEAATIEETILEICHRRMKNG